MNKHKIKANNIKCSGCATSIRNALLNIDGIKNVQVNVDGGEVSFDSNSDKSKDDLAIKLASMGYPIDDASTIQTAKSYVNCMIGKIQNNLS